MKSPLLLASTALLAAAVATPSLAGDHGKRTRSSHHGFDHAMQVVPTSTRAGEPGHGWRYFTDPAARRAVVISPQGEYYFSRGKGLRLVAVTQPGD